MIGSMILIAILICPLSIMNISSAAPDHASPHHNNPLTQIFHLTEMTLTTLGNISLATLFLLVALLVGTAPLLSIQTDFRPPQSTSLYKYFVRRRDLSYLTKKDIYSWLALFERAPNFIRTT